MERATLRRALKLKRRSVFCLEPPGFSPPRKSFVDSFLSGCLPVFFYKPEEYAHLLPHYLSGWGENASVRVDAQSALDGTVDVLDTLVRIPPPVVARMQQTLAAEGHRLVYGYGRRGVRDDAIDRLLEVLSRGG